jgi:solute carrier family 35, member E1
VPLAFIGWYVLSIVYSLLNKEVLNVWQFPVVFSAVQLLVGAMWIGALWMPLPTFGLKARRFAPVREPPRLTRAELSQVSIVALWLALGHVLSTVSPAYGTVAFTNVVKTLEPLFTCFFSAIFLKQVFSVPVYLSLVPVIFGVALASANEVSFSMISLISGLLSNVCFALRAISAKRVMGKKVGDNLDAQNLYGVLTIVALVAIVPLALLAEGRTIVAGTLATVEKVGLQRFLRMLLYSGLSHYTYNECAFLALDSIHPVTHAVANTIKRVAVIVLSVLYFRNPLTLTGALGSAIAIVGVMLYSIAKATDKPPPTTLATAAKGRPSSRSEPKKRV